MNTSVNTSGHLLLSDLSFPDWMRHVQAQTEAALDRLLPAADTTPTHLHQAMRYACLGGGKRIRPLLAFAAGELSAAPATRLETVACAVECIHAYSLVHDDLPCMDDDVLRRGRPTCHVKFGEATALLVGDSLQSLAFELLTHPLSGDPQIQLRQALLLAQASGSRGMAGGQAIDLDAVGKALNSQELEQMHTLKTGALIRAAVLLGALCGESPDETALAKLDRFAASAGLLFQVIDDMLDCTANTTTLGKTAGKDAAADKPTYVSLLGLAGARDLAERLQTQAVSALKPFGEKARRLTELTDFFVRREF